MISPLGFLTIIGILLRMMWSRFHAFFSYSCIPKGCNASVYIVILQVRYLKIARDFRPLSLFGSNIILLVNF